MIFMEKETLLEKLNNSTKNTLMETLDIVYTDIDTDYLVATMPVNSKVHQPAGLLHGGASVALAESVGSTAAHFSIDIEKQEIRGLEITANHIRGIREGLVKAIAKPIHKGRTTQLWEVRIVDEQEKLISICKLTVIVLAKK
ncbi:hotdog fold thioesterase [Aureibaculum marinum]|uniref:Hotdog fold thioesterase n=2 Tax=Aureibaculum marinum TaxID=2487930 RepID=A0A3N4PB34_9FLAO|nr:hotdog fold thioesterase [Aureibaculum marinum]